MASRSSCYKTKQSALDKREKRILRVHRRSLDQREMRQVEVNKRRQIEIEMSPVIESRGGSKIPSRNTTPDCHNEKASLSRQEKFRKWKEERELTRKIEAMEKARIKPGFKVTHISYTDTKLFTKDDPKESSSKKSHKKILKNSPIKSVKSAPAPTKRTLRSTGTSAVVNSSIPKSSSSNKKQNSLLAKNHEQMVVKRKANTVSTSPDSKKLKALSSKNKVSLQTVGQGHFMAPTRSSSRKTVSKMKQDIPHSEDKKTKYKSQDNKIMYNQHKPADARKVSTLRGNVKESVAPSFAPTNFAFAAPGSICSFVFKPLSPASAASFLYPNSDNTNMSLFSNSVGRTSTPKAKSVQSLCDYSDSQSNNGWMTKSEIDVSNRSGTVSSKHTLLRGDYKESTGDMLQKGSFPEEQESDSVDCTAKESENVEVAESFIPTSQKHKSTFNTKSVHNLSDASMMPLQETLESANKSLSRSMELNSKNALSNAEICPTVQTLGDDNMSEYQKELDRNSTIDSEVGYQTEKNAKASKIRQKSLHDYAVNLDAEHLEHIKASPGRRISRQLSKSITNNMVIETKPELEMTHGRSRRSCRSLLPDCKAKLESPCMINQAEVTNYMPSSNPSFVHFESFGSQHTDKSSIEDGKIHHENPSLEVASFIVGAETETLKGTSSVLEQNTDAEKSVRKFRSLRRSAARSNKDHSQPEAIEKEEAKQLLSVAMPKGNRQENLNPKLRRSRRSVAKTDTFTLPESVPSELSTGEVEMKSFETPRSTTCRKSLICTSALTTLQEDEQQLVMHKVEENCGFVGKSLSDSIAGSPSLKELVLNQDVSSAVERETALSIDLCSERETVSNDIVLSVQKTPKRTRRSLHLPGASDGFLTPGLPLSIQKRSTAKRRRTATMIALSSAKSPEEAIKIISTSPMVEMTRRTPKHISPELIKNCTALLFSDDDLSMEPIKLFSDPKEQHKIANSSPTSFPGKEENIPSSITLEENQKQKDVSYFRCLLNAETEKLAALGDMWESIGQSVSGLCEEVQGQIRTTVCQARLLIGDKFQQFAGLVDDCERGDPRTTCQDLQGFWDLICIPVEDLNKKFAALVTLKDNNWQLDLNEPATLPVKKGTKKRMPATKVDKPVGKSKFAAFKAHLIQQRTKTDVTEEKVFDAGFFKVSSPVHTPVFHCEAGTPNKQKSPFNSTREPENKENVAHRLLRRSRGTMSPHTNYIPSKPSPLQDTSLVSRKSCIARHPSERQFSTSQDELGVRQEEESVANSVKQSHEVPTAPSTKSTPCRRSTRIRKSVCFVDPEPSVNQPETVRNNGPVDLTAYLQPSTYSNNNSPFQANSVEDSPFNCDSLLINSTNINSNHSILTDTLSTPVIPLLSAPGNGQKNYQKRLPSAERRKSRRSVSFALSPSQNLQSCTQALPSTPYNRDSIVASQRILRRSNLGNICEAEFSNEMQSLKDIYPKPSSRPSLLFTPPQKSQSHSPLVCNDVPVATLISFTP